MNDLYNIILHAVLDAPIVDICNAPGDLGHIGKRLTIVASIPSSVATYNESLTRVFWRRGSTFQNEVLLNRGVEIFLYFGQRGLGILESTIPHVAVI